jgi:hypothetical protein
MNYAQFAEYVRRIEDDLVSKFGISRDAAKKIAIRVEIDSIHDYNSNKDQRQLIMEYREHGPVRLAEITGISRETLRKKYNDACANQYKANVAA